MSANAANANARGAQDSSASSSSASSLLRRGAAALGFSTEVSSASARSRKMHRGHSESPAHASTSSGAGADPPVDPIFDYQFRLILIGDSTVGKSSLLRHFTDGTFAEVSDPTVGVDFFARVVRVDDGTRIKLQLWDTAGQERFRSITKSYYRNSVGALLVYDIGNADSFRHIPVWMMEAKRHIEPHRAVFVLVGCKFDLAAGNPRAREVSAEEARAFAESHDIGFLETSAKTGYNVEDTFQLLTQQIYDKIQTGEFQLEAGWDGIKKGVFGSNGQAMRLRNGNSSGYPRGLYDGRGVPEAEPVGSKCC